MKPLLNLSAGKIRPFERAISPEPGPFTPTLPYWARDDSNKQINRRSEQHTEQILRRELSITVGFSARHLVRRKHPSPKGDAN